jgi:hypothetical protein
VVSQFIGAGPIYDASDIAKDPYFKMRGMLEEHKFSIEVGQHNTVSFSGIIIKLSETPGAM